MTDYINRGGGSISLQNLFNEILDQEFEIKCVIILCEKNHNHHLFTHSSSKDDRVDNLEALREYIPEALRMLKE